MTTNGPTTGRTVLYVLAAEDGVRAEAVGKVRPAVVVEDNGGCGSCNLKIALDGANDWPWSPVPDHLHKTSVSPGTSPGTWRWPVMAPPAAVAPAPVPPAAPVLAAAPRLVSPDDNSTPSSDKSELPSD